MKGKSNLLKKMMAMLLTAVLIMGMVVGVVPEEVHAETLTSTDGNYEYTLNEDQKTVAITKYNGQDKILNIPSQIDGKTVTAIESPGNNVGGFPDITVEVKIPSSVTSIGDSAFAFCYTLTTVTIPESVTSIGDFAFKSCSSLETVTIPGSVTSIGDSAFVCCDKLTTVTISEGVTSIGDSAFAYCDKLTTVTIPESVTSIGVDAFFKCTSLTTVTIPESVTSIGRDAFKYTNSNLTVTYESCKHNWAEINNQDDNLNNKVKYNPDLSAPLDKKEAKAATCTEDGYKEEYYECSGCHGAYSDENGANPIAAENIIPAKGHTPTDAVEENRVDATCAKEGSYDMVVYCSVCNGVISRTTKPIEKKAHSYGGWTVTKQPTESEEGLQERSCSVCGYKQTEIIPKTGNTGSGDSTGSGGNTGKIETVEEKGENTPDADFQMSNDDLISAVLTPEEQSLVEAGTDVKIILDIDNIDSSVNASDKQAVTDKADGYNVGQYLDINLYKIIGKDKTKVSQTNGKIKIALAVPDNLKNTDSAKTRSFSVVRVHDGAAEMLADLDNDATTITIETDMFSTYALVYKDTLITDDNSANKQKDNEPKTGNTTPIEIYATLAMIAGLSYLLLLFGNRKRGMTEQEKKEWIAMLVAWGRKGGALRKVAALVAIFLLLAYYHSIGKKIYVKEVEAIIKKKGSVLA